MLDDEPSFMELPAYCVVGLTSRIVNIPSPPPFCPDDEIEDRIQCPRCNRITSISESGMTTCTKCNHLLFISDDGHVIWPSYEWDERNCPNCGRVSEFVGRRLVCPQCGFEVAGDTSDCSGFQIISPENLESWCEGGE